MASGALKIRRYGHDLLEEHEHLLDDASVDVEPGMVLERVNDAGEIKLQPHSTAAGTDARRYVAVEARDRGMSANLADSDPYSTDGDNFVRYVEVIGGGVHVALAAGSDLASASLANITATDKLVSAGDGTVRAYDSANDAADAVVFEAEESLDNSGAAAGEAALLEVVRADEV
jgi:hypothetical protein